MFRGKVEFFLQIRITDVVDSDAFSLYLIPSKRVMYWNVDVFCR